jgi:hypothetical protein
MKRPVIAATLALLPDASSAQVGLSSPLGGFFVLVAIAALALAGLAMAAASSIQLARRGRSAARLAILILGLVFVAPAVWIGAVLLADEIPRELHWDLSASRSVAQLGPKEPVRVDGREHDAEYHWQGKLHTSIKLPAGRQWAGSARSVYLRAKAGQIVALDWRGAFASSGESYREAGRILVGLGFIGHRLDEWRAAAGGSDPRAFSAEGGADPTIRVDVRRTSPLEEPPPQQREWYVNVYLRW